MQSLFVIFLIPKVFCFQIQNERMSFKDKKTLVALPAKQELLQVSFCYMQLLVKNTYNKQLVQQD